MPLDKLNVCDLIDLKSVLLSKKGKYSFDQIRITLLGRNKKEMLIEALTCGVSFYRYGENVVLLVKKTQISSPMMSTCT